MNSGARLLAVIPARGGSKGLPGKNTRLFAGLPLIAHSILYARSCPEIDRCIVSTDAPEIADVARRFGADVPFLRPKTLAEDSTSLFPVLRHSLVTLEETDDPFEYVLLLDPTSPARVPQDVPTALRRLKAEKDADGIVSVSQPDFNPIWNCVTDRNGWMTPLISEGVAFDRRQDVPTVYRINGALYIWRAEFLRKHEGSWREASKHLMYEIPESRAMSIDSLSEFQRAELLVTSGLIDFRWRETPPVSGGESNY